MRDALLLVGAWSHAAAALLFGMLALWQLRLSPAGVRNRLLATAFFLTALWALATALGSPAAVTAQLLESARNLSWLAFMLLLLRGGVGGGQLAIRALYTVVALVIGGQCAVDLLPAFFTGSPRIAEAFIFASLVLRMTTAIGALVLLHNLYTAAAPGVRSGIRLSIIALAAMWTYDLNVYTVAYLARAASEPILAVRGLAMVALVPVFALGARRNQGWRMRLSRTATFQSLSLMAIGGYLVAMVLIVRVIEIVGGGFTQIAQITVVFGMTITALALLPSRRLRAWAKVKIAKHFFAHRYDYRAEWLRFTETLGRPRAEGGSLDERVVKAIADMVEAPGALLLGCTEGGELAVQARWRWPTLDAPPTGADAGVAAWLGATGRILALQELREGGAEATTEAAMVPAWMLAEPRAWALVPLIHFDRLIGAVLLERPRAERPLDWEDFDLLRVAGRQAASYLAEARGQEALSDARRFDEFNRRFAFILHDIKNLVSQLALVARNAERHAENPDFRKDMVATLNVSAARMNDLLQRLSQRERTRADEPRPVALKAFARAMADARRSLHPIEVEGDERVMAMADAGRLEQALGHIVQNACDASAPGQPVTVTVTSAHGAARLAVADRGVGMSAEFIARELFRPFASTKSGGFGVGAHEARSLVATMGGRLEVESTEGRGSRFTVVLPLAEPRSEHSAGRHVIERSAA